MSDHDEITALRAALAAATARAEVAERERDEARVEVAGLRYALEMAEAAESFAAQEAYEDTDAHRLECALLQIAEVEAANARLAARAEAAEAQVAAAKEAASRALRMLDGFRDWHGEDDNSDDELRRARKEADAVRIVLSNLTTAARERDRRRDEETVARCVDVVRERAATIRRTRDAGPVLSRLVAQMSHADAVAMTLATLDGVERDVRAVLGEEPQR